MEFLGVYGKYCSGCSWFSICEPFSNENNIMQNRVVKRILSCCLPKEVGGKNQEPFFSEGEVFSALASS